MTPLLLGSYLSTPLPLVFTSPSDHHTPSIVDHARKRIIIKKIKFFDDDPFIVLTETKFSFRCIPVWIRTGRRRGNLSIMMTPDVTVAVVTPLNNPGGPEGDTVTAE